MHDVVASRYHRVRSASGGCQTPTASKMLRLLLVSACIGTLLAQKIHITLRNQEDLSPDQNLYTTDEEAPTTVQPPSLHVQLLNNIKEKGVQAFVGEISLGTPPQLMSVTFDTASVLSYFPSVRCDDTFCKTRRRYNASASSTYKEVGTAFELPSGQNASGVLSSDSLGVAGVSVDGVVFGEAENMWNKWLPIMPQDGVMGLGLRGLAPEGVRPLLDVMTERGLISERVFGMWLGEDPAGGQLSLGGVDERLYRGELTWVNLTSDQWWAARADGVSLTGRLDLCASSSSCIVMPSASSPYFIVSEARGKLINEALGGLDIGQPGAAGLDCTTLYQLPTLNVTVGGRTMQMGPLEYTFILRFEGGLQMCISGFLGLPYVDDNTLLLGTLFMQKFYVAYDQDNLRLGFADNA